MNVQMLPRRRWRLTPMVALASLMVGGCCNPPAVPPPPAEFWGAWYIVNDKPSATSTTSSYKMFLTLLDKNPSFQKDCTVTVNGRWQISRWEPTPGSLSVLDVSQFKALNQSSSERWGACEIPSRVLVSCENREATAVHMASTMPTFLHPDWLEGKCK